jgi:SPP1 gp7 family putative phage head morphogenesis protein
MRTLRGVADQIGRLITGFTNPVEDPETDPLIGEALSTYAELLRPWAASVATRIIAAVDREDAQAWAKHAATMQRSLRDELARAPTGALVKQRMADQVTLITSLPTDAAGRVHELTLAAIADGTRAKEIAAEIARSGEVSFGRAALIARTEVSRTGVELTSARALSVGSEDFVWHTVGDSDVRHDHRILDGKAFKWTDPPVADQRTGGRYLPGAGPNCRCWAEPLIPDDY